MFFYLRPKLFNQFFFNFFNLLGYPLFDNSGVIDKHQSRIKKFPITLQIMLHFIESSLILDLDIFTFDPHGFPFLFEEFVLDSV